MRVTKEQVERLAKARIEYDRAIDWIAHGEQAERSGHIEPTLTTERLRDMADAAGARIERRDYAGHASWRFEAFGVEFYHMEEIPEGGDA